MVAQSGTVAGRRADDGVDVGPIAARGYQPRFRVSVSDCPEPVLAIENR